MRIAIDIDGQFKKMTGIQHSVDSLIDGLYDLNSAHQIVAFASTLPGPDAIADAASKQTGTFSWAKLPQAELDTAIARPRTFVPLGFQKKHPWFSTQIQIREQRHLRSLLRPVTTSEAQRVRAYDLFHVPEPYDLRFLGYEPRCAIATVYDFATRVCAWAYEAPAIATWEGYFDFIKNKCGHIVAISEATKAGIVEELKITPDRVTVTPLAARTSTKRIDDKVACREILSEWDLAGAPFVLYSGTLEPRKNLERLVKAFAMLVKEDNSLKDHKLVLAGGNWLRYDLELRILSCECGIGGRVVTTGYVSNEQMNALMSSCEAFVYISTYEGFGMPPLEAMTCGAPVIVSNTSSLPEVVGDAGILVAPNSIPDIAAAMHGLLTDGNENALRRRLSIAQAARFSWRRTAELTFKAYEAAVAS